MAAEEGVATAHRVVAQYPNGSAAVRSQAPGTTYTNDFARRAKAGKSVVEMLEACGAFGNMPKTTQLSLFS